jgi:hypothetical protein
MRPRLSATEVGPPKICFSHRRLPQRLRALHRRGWLRTPPVLSATPSNAKKIRIIKELRACERSPDSAPSLKRSRAEGGGRPRQQRHSQDDRLAAYRSGFSKTDYCRDHLLRKADIHQHHMIVIMVNDAVEGRNQLQFALRRNPTSAAFIIQLTSGDVSTDGPAKRDGVGVIAASQRKPVTLRRCGRISADIGIRLRCRT